MIRTVVAVCILLCFSSVAHAQVGFGRQLELSVIPEHPGAEEEVFLSVKTYALDLGRSEIIWYANDKEIARGNGLTETMIRTGGLGSETRIAVVAENADEGAASAEATIRPTEIDLLWEAESYTPPFYHGRALAGANTLIRAHALARFRAGNEFVSDSNIVYSWYRDTTLVSEGRGRSRVVLPGPDLFSSATIRVVARSADKAHSGEARTRIYSIDPFVLLYENHPLFGILYHRSLELGATTLETEQKLTAVPYFANLRAPNDRGLLYDWSVNGSRIEPDPNQPQTLTIAAQGYSGPADIRLTLTSASDMLLNAVGEWRLTFGGETSSFLSGMNPFGN